MKANKNIYNKIEKSVLRIVTGHRGGGVEISLDNFGYKGEKMTAYQNYLGGGLLGAIANDCTRRGWDSDEKLTGIAANLRLYYFNQQNDDCNLDEYNDDFDSLEKRSVSAY